MAFHLKKRRILVIKNRAIGDTILMTGPLRLLKRHWPNYEIHVLVRAPAGELLEGLPYIDRVISANEPTSKIDRFAYWMRLLRRLREKKYDYVLNFHASFRTSLTAWLLRTETRVANHHELKGRNWFSDLLVPGRGKVKSVIDRDLDVLRALGLSVHIEDAMPEIVLSAMEKKQAAEIFKNDTGSGSGPRIFLGIGASKETKRWPAAHYIKLIQKLISEQNARIVLSTVQSDKAWLEHFWKLVREHSNLTSQITHFESRSLRETAKVMSQCSTYVGNDSGLKHLAVALGLSTFTFFGPESPLEWHPYEKKRHAYGFLEQLACRTETGKHWCPILVCNKHQHQCMQGMQPETVLAEITRILKN